MNLWFDFETRSETKLGSRGQKGRGLGVYSEDPSTRVLLIAYALGDGPVIVHDYTVHPMLPPDFLAALRDPGVIKTAWNAQFEHTILRKVLGIDVPLNQWLDPSILARQVTLPGALADVCRSLHLGEDQSKRSGGKYIKMFSELTKSGKRAIAQGAPEKYFRDRSTNPAEWAQLSNIRAATWSRCAP